MFSKSIFQSNTFRTFAAAILGVWVAYFSGQMDLQAAISATVTSVVGMGLRLITNGPVHITTPVSATQAAPGQPVVKTAAGQVVP